MEISNSLDQSSSITQATRADIYVKRTRIQCASRANSEEGDDNGLVEHPLIKDAEEDEKLRLLSLKIRQCNKIFDFANLFSNQKGKQIKSTALAEIIDYIANGDDGHFEEFMYREIQTMVSRNIFREFHQAERHDFEFDDEEPTLEIAWPHIQLVYEILLRFLDSPRFNAGTAKKHFDRDFIVNLLKMFNSEDPRERDYLKTILHRMYGKFLVYRAFIRKEINHIFLSFIFEEVNCSGIGELLEILGSIINGFTVPLKAEHKRFLEKVLLPLYSSKHLQQYHSQLCYCICQFLSKEPNLGTTVINRMLKYWPKTSSMKEIVFINELYEVLPNIPFDDLKDVVVSLFRRICISACSSHFQVAEAAIKFLREEQNMMLVAHYPDELHPVMLPILHKIAHEHWHTSIQTLSKIVARQIASETGSIDGTQATVDESEKMARDREERHEELFQRLEQITVADDCPPTCPTAADAPSDESCEPPI